MVRVNKSKARYFIFIYAASFTIPTKVQQATHAVHTIGESKNNRVNAMAAMNSGYDSYKAAQSIGNLNNPNPQANSASIKVSLTYGQQKSKQENHSQSTVASASQINAGGAAITDMRWLKSLISGCYTSHITTITREPFL
ncbi:hypothetical protein PT286_03570 [Neisseriaceae bacterium ESL0693]|nr:hypothetical protein [Neisseriaceae bacterium ESL0693]